MWVLEGEKVRNGGYRSALSHTPAEARHTVDDDRNTLFGHVLSRPLHAFHNDIKIRIIYCLKEKNKLQRGHSRRPRHDTRRRMEKHCRQDTRHRHRYTFRQHHTEEKKNWLNLNFFNLIRTSPVAARHNVPDALNRSVGQDNDVPSQRSSTYSTHESLMNFRNIILITSQMLAAERHTVDDDLGV